MNGSILYGLAEMPSVGHNDIQRLDGCVIR